MKKEGEIKTKTTTNIKCWKWKLVLQVSRARTIRYDPSRSDPNSKSDEMRTHGSHSRRSRILSTFLFRVRMINNKSNAKMSVMYVACQRLRLFMAWINKNNAPIRDDKLTQRQKTTWKKKMNIFVDGWECFSYKMGPPSPSLYHAPIPQSPTQLVVFEIGIEIENVWKRFRKCRWRVSQTNDYECDASCRLSLMTAMTLRAPRWWVLWLDGRKFRTDAETTLWRLIESWAQP